MKYVASSCDIYRCQNGFTFALYDQDGDKLVAFIAVSDLELLALLRDRVEWVPRNPSKEVVDA